MPEPRIHVDFNGIDDDGRISALRRHADNPAEVEAGSAVQLWDEDGNTALGRIVELGDRDLLRIQIVPGSWRPGPSTVTPIEPEVHAGALGYVGRSAFDDAIALWTDDPQTGFKFPPDFEWWKDENTRWRVVLVRWRMTSPFLTTGSPELTKWGDTLCTFSFGGSTVPTTESSDIPAGRSSLRIAR